MSLFLPIVSDQRIHARGGFGEHLSVVILAVERFHLARAAFFAMRLRLSALSFTARTLPPLLPPLRPRFAASGFACCPAGRGFGPSPVAALTISKAVSFRSRLSFLDRGIEARYLAPPTVATLSRRKLAHHRIARFALRPLSYQTTSCYNGPAASGHGIQSQPHGYPPAIAVSFSGPFRVGPDPTRD